MPLSPEKIKAARNALGITQREAARRSGMPQPHWARIEAGRTPNPTLSTLEAVARAVGVGIREITTGREPMKLYVAEYHVDYEYGHSIGAFTSRELAAECMKTHAGEDWDSVTRDDRWPDAWFLPSTHYIVRAFELDDLGKEKYT